MNRNWLACYGIDYDKGLENCTGNPEFYKKILKMFAEDTCFERAKAACLGGDQRTLFSCLHELKGVSGNMALTELYNSTVPLVEQLRTKDIDREEMEQLFAVIETAYHRTCEGVALIIAES